MRSIPYYSEKPTLYLDQNILDLFVKDSTGNAGLALAEDCQVVYSNETLKEIRRSTGYENKFLDVLNRLKAYHLKIIVEQPGFVITDQATITNRNVFDAYAEYCSNDDEFGHFENAIYQWLFKFSGGRPENSLADIHGEQIYAFKNLLRNMVKNTEEAPIDNESQLQDISEKMSKYFSSILHDLEQEISKTIPDTRNWNAIKSFRTSMDIGPKELNNITAPNVIEKIWQVVSKKLSPSDSLLTIDDFFRLNANPVNPSEEYHMHQKVTTMYNILNSIGYFPDSKVHNEKRFYAAMSDTSHASLASFCDLLLSRDENFVKKVEAIYEYLEVPTKVILVKLD